MGDRLPGRAVGGEAGRPGAWGRMGEESTPLRLRGLPSTSACGHEVPLACSRLARLLGLALITRRRAGPGLLLPRCRSVHTFGMRFRLDVLFLDGGGAVIRNCRDVPCGRVLTCRRAVAVLELPARRVPGAEAAGGEPASRLP